MALTFSEAFAAGAKAYKEGRKEGRSTRRNARLPRLASFRRLVASLGSSFSRLFQSSNLQHKTRD